MSPPAEAAPHSFEARADEQLAKPFLREAVAKATDHSVEAMRQLFDPAEREALRKRGAEIRAEAVANLPALIDELDATCTANGVQVHRARDAAEARAVVSRIVQQAGASSVVKSKSMLSEEIGLNPALEADGIAVVETDLGEYLVQIDGDRPSHIIAPALHLNRQQVRESLSRVAGRLLPPEPEALAAFAREQLRATFLAADVGITGVNFGVAATGTLVLSSAR